MKLIHLLPFAIVPLAAASGCTAEEVPDQLEALTVSVSASSYLDSQWENLEASGVLSVTGQGRDFHLDVGAGTLEVDLHVPGMSDLSLLEGRDVRIALSREPGPYTDRLTVVIEDTGGPLFVASSQPGSHEAIHWGETVAEEEVDGVVWGYTTVSVVDDGAGLALMPGDAAFASLDGASWRIVPIAAYRVEDDSDHQFDCILPPDVLSFEMIRVDSSTEPVRVERPAELPAMRTLTCG